MTACGPHRERRMGDAWKKVVEFNREHGKVTAVIVALVVGFILGVMT